MNEGLEREEMSENKDQGGTTTNTEGGKEPQTTPKEMAEVRS